MPRLASKRLVAEMQRKTEEHFYGDTATLLQETVDSYDAYNQPVTSTTSTAIECSFTDELGADNLEKWKNYTDITQIIAEIRFSTPAPASGNKITLTGRFDGTSYADKTFEIIGIRDRDAFGYVCALKLVQS